MNRPLSLVRPIVLASMLAASAAAHASFTVYTSEASFLAAISEFATDTFDDLTPGQSYTGPLSRSVGGATYTVSTGPESDALYGAGSTGDAWLSNATARDTITFDNFSASVFAAGAYFFGSDINGDALNKGILLVKATDTNNDSVTKFKLASTTSTFFGFVSDTQLSRLTVRVISGNNSPVWPTVNNLTLAAAVPEPETYALLLSGLAVVGFLARRRRDN